MSKKVFQRILIVGVATTLGAVVAIWFGVVSPEREQYLIPHAKKKSLPDDWNSTLKVGIIGDSWVAGEKLDEPLKMWLAEHQIHVDVISSGQSGAKSRQVARNWHDHRADWADSSVDYVVIIVGVNDAAGHVGADRYAYHVEHMAKDVIRFGMHPVVVELPEFGIESLPNRSIPSTIKANLFRSLFDGGKSNVIAGYREELLRSLESEIAQGTLTFVDFDKICTDYERDGVELFQDPAHLNAKGTARLAATIAEAIAQTHEQRLGN